MRSIASLAVFGLILTISAGAWAEPQSSTAPAGTATQSVDPSTGTAPAGQPAQQQAEPVLETREQATPVSGRSVPAGTEIRATLDEPLSSKTARAGEQFNVTVAQPVQAADGSLAIPAGAKVRGEITQVEEGKTLPAVRGRGRINMRFRELVLPGGKVLPLTATLQSAHDTKGAERSKTGEEGEVEGRTRTEDVVRDVGIGAAAGTVAGLIFGNVVRGLAIGAIAGGGYVLATRGKDVELPAQTGLVLRLDQAVTVPHQTGTR